MPEWKPRRPHWGTNPRRAVKLLGLLLHEEQHPEIRNPEQETQIQMAGRYLHISQPLVSRAVRYALTQEWIESRTHPDYGKSDMLTVTDKGRAFFHENIHEVIAILQRGQDASEDERLFGFMRHFHHDKPPYEPKHDTVPLQKIRKNMGYPKKGMSRVLRPLEKQGLITTESLSDEQRLAHEKESYGARLGVTVTPEGRRHFREMIERKKQPGQQEPPAK